ncbi:MAG: peptidase M19, partial [Limnobacter sp.]|nr:peptidase M19 [Limnobacter sp.]
MRQTLWATALVTLVAACGSGDSAVTPTDTGFNPSEGGNPGGPSEVVEINKFTPANKCYGLQSAENRQYVLPASTSYRAGPATEAEAFTLKPTGLGEYLLFGTDSNIVTRQGDTLVANAEPTDNSIWIAEYDDTEGYFRFKDGAGRLLALDSEGGLELVFEGDSKGDFLLMEDTDCAAYPEMPVSMAGEPYKGKGVNQPVIGFADTHT